MSRTISTGTTGPVILSASDNPVTITSTGTVTSTGSADGIDGGTGTTWTIANAGVVSASSAGNGVSLASSGIISNTGSISGKEGLLLRGGGSVTNDVGGSISGLGARTFGFGSGAGVYITGGAGTVTNRGTISGVGYGVAIGAGGLVTNFSSITGGEDGVVAQLAATISNYGNITATVDDGIGLFAGGSVTNASGASITGAGTYGAGVFIMGGVGTVTNAGSITSPNHNAVLMTGGGSLSNLATGFISGPGVGVFIKNNPGTVTNAGLITGTGSQGTGIYLENGGGLTNTSTGTITGHQFGAFLAGAFTTLANYGSISGATYNGAVLALGGIVTNAAGASISGLSGGVYIKSSAAGTITNSGNISATGTGSAAIDLADGGVVTNNSNGSISGVAFGVFVTGAAAAITNNGSITSTIYGAVKLSNGGSVTNRAGASIKGGSSGVYVQLGPGTITNSGAINAASAGGAGAGLSGGGTITNNSGGSISGSAFGVFTTGTLATVDNSGSISGSHGVGLNAGGSVTNTASASISGQVAGVSSQGGAITLSNAGSISATAGAGADIEFGGSITNLAGATISGTSFGVFLTGGSGAVTNAGTISGGSYAVDFAGSGTNRLVVDPGAVFVGAVTGGGGTSTLELAGGTGSIGGVGTGSFNKFQAVVIDAGGTWTLNGANIAATVSNNGTAIIAGSLDVSTAISASSTGLFQLGSGAMLEVAAATGTTTQINFQNSTSELIIDNAALFGTNVGTSSYAGPQLQHFFPGDKIDLKSFSSAGVTLNYNASTGVLQVANSANQVASVDFQTSSLGGTTFTAVSDGGNGIIITDVASAPTVTSLTDVTSNGTDLDAGQTVTFTLTASEALTIGAGAALTLSNNATAVYNSSSGKFVYTVASGQDIADLKVTGYSGTITDATGNALVASGVTLDTGVKIDTTAATVTSLTDVTSNGTDLGVGQTVTFTLTASEALTIGAGAALTLSNNATAIYNSSSGKFVYTVAAGQNTADLKVTGYSGSITDAAGNALVASGVSLDTGVKIDTTAPAAPTIADAADVNGTVNAANDTSAQALTGTAGANDTINIYLNGGTTPAYTTQANAGGNWSQTIGVLAAGSYSYTATATDAAGNVSAPSSPLAFTVNTTAPAAPTIADAADVNGTVNAANDTSAQALTGTAGANDTINIYLNGGTTPAYTTQANAGGNWSQTIGVLAAGSYSYTATATDAAGNVSAPSSPLAFTVNTTAPAAPTIADAADVNGTVNAANDTSAQALTGTAGANDTINIYLNGGTTPAYTTQANAGGNWSQTIGVLAAGSYSYTATATDAAGNVSAPSSPLAFTVNTTAPAAPTIADAADVNGTVNAANDTSAQALTGTAGANDTINIYLNGGTTPAYTTQANAGGNWSQTIGVLAAGSYSYTATATDAAGNVSAPSSPLAFTVNTTAPAAPTIADAADVNGTVNAANDTSAQALTGTAGANDTINIYLNGGTTPAYTTQANAGGNWSQTIGVLAAGSYSYTATATDAAGNVSAPSSPLAFTVNTTAPAAPTIADAADVNGTVNAANDTSAQALTGTAGANDTINIYLNGGTTPAYTTQANAGGNWSQTIGVLAAGSYSYTATATDAAGNVSAPSSPLAFTVDATAPSIAISTIASNNIINATKAAQGFAIRGTTSGAENGQTVTVNILNSANMIVDSYTTKENNNAWSVSVTSAQATALVDGSYTVTANVSDRAGNPAPTATHALTVDEDKLPEVPALTITNTSSLTVLAGGSVPLGITATPVDSDDKLSVKITGLPSYEVITAPAGDSVTHQRQSNGTYTWTITEGSSTTGNTLSGLSLTSNYTGTGHPIATLVVTASNTTSGETASSAPLTMSVTDPPSTMSSSATLVFGAALDENTTFAAGATGTLKLDHAENFTGSVSGFGAGDKLDLMDITFGANLTIGYSANAAGTGGTLSISDATHSASIALFGQFAAAGFHAASDAGSGTMVTYTHPDQRTASLLTLPKS